MKINCVLIDDEPLALALLKDFASRIPFLNITGSFNSAQEALLFMKGNQVDLVFMDINMPDIDGFSLLKELGKEIMVVFCTAYHEYAVDGFNVKALDYLVKPYSFERFLRAACYAQENFILKQAKGYLASNQKEISNYLFVKSEYSLVKININEIVLLEGLKDYIKIYTTVNEKPILTLQSLRVLEEKLPPEYFFRIHKSYIINLRMVKSVQRNHVVIGEREIPLGNQFKEAFLAIIEKFTPGK